MNLGEAVAAARPRVIGALAAQFRDLDLAEDSFAAATEALLDQAETVSDVAAWLYVTARRKALDIMRRRGAEQRAFDASRMEAPIAEIIELPDPIPDERLRLIFICCHPALSLEARVALTMRIVCGVAVKHIADAFLVGEATMYQRITRAKEKIRKAGVPFETPGRRQWEERLEAVLLTFELAFTVAYRDSASSGGNDEVSAQVDRLSKMLVDLVPDNPEVLGLRALVLLTASRKDARLDPDGMMIPLSEQDPERWDSEQIEAARQMLDRAAEFESSGAYQLMTSIHLAHATRKFTGRTDWVGIVRLYDVLAVLRPTSVTAINRALAIGKANGAQAGLKALDEIDEGRMSRFLPYHAAKAHLHRDAGQSDLAKFHFETALDLEPSQAERLYLETCLEACSCN